MTARDVGTNMVPNSALPTGQNAASATGRATLLSSAIAKEMLILLASDLPSRNKYPAPRSSFTKRLQPQRVAKQTSQSTTLIRSQYKLTLWKQRLKKNKSTKTHFGKKLPKQVTNVYLDVLYASVELELLYRSEKKLRARSTLELR